MKTLSTIALLTAAIAFSGCDDADENEPSGAGGAGGAMAEPEPTPEPGEPEPTPEPGEPEPGEPEPMPDPGEPEPMPEPMPDPEPGEWDPAGYAAIIMAAPWAADMNLALDGETLTIADDGIPDRGAVAVYVVPDGTTTGVLESAYTQMIPMRPVLADEPTDTNLGAIGVTLSGGLMFNPYEGGGEFALDSNFEVDGLPFIDACNGHPLGQGTGYHYHGVPYCITDEVDQPGEHSALIGILLDGFPIYGPQDVDGAPPADLDRCSGHFGPTPEFPNGIYHYHLTETAPYSIDCYAGEVQAMGGPGGGGPGGGGPGGDREATACEDGQDSGCCGDDVCDGPETAANCPADCE